MAITTHLADTAHAAARRVGLDASRVEPLWNHASSLFLLSPAQVVARISRDADDQHRARVSLAITWWLIAQGFPATAPAEVDQPVRIDGATVTFWRYYPQHDQQRPPAAALGVLLRKLHQMPPPPVKLPTYQALQTLGEAIKRSTTLPADDRDWLADRRQRLLDAYESLSFPLGIGLIHGDAYPGNTLWDGAHPLLGDWDEVSIGPRELDLVNTHQGSRFGRSAVERQRFSAAYGYDVTGWPGFAVLREMRDLHTLASYIRLADEGVTPAHTELTFRLQTLKAGQDHVRWNAR